MYGGPGDEYRVPEYVRTYPRGMEYSTRVLEDMEPRARKLDSWMHAVGVFFNRGAVPALRPRPRGKAFRLALLVLGRLACLATNYFDQGNVGYSKAARGKL